MPAGTDEGESRARDRVVVIGAGPAGLSAALNLARARASVVVVDAGRPRNAATLRSHGFLTRDGMSPLELRKLGLAELDAYPNVRVLNRSVVVGVTRAPVPNGARLSVTVSVRDSSGPVVVEATAVVAASGLRETLPEIPGLRSFYGMSLFSCIVCDGWELKDRPLALIGHTPDLGAHARLIARWTDALTVFTDGADIIAPGEEAELAERGVRIDRRSIAALEGDRGALARVRLSDGDAVAVDGGFVRPLWHPAAGFLDRLGVERDANGCLLTDVDGRTSAAGVYAAGDVVSPGPQQLIVAAGAGARAAAAVMRDLSRAGEPATVPVATSAVHRDGSGRVTPLAPIRR